MREESQRQWHNLAQWFQARQSELPRAPFWLDTGIFVADPVPFYEGLTRDIQQGPIAPRAEALLGDLLALFERWSLQREHEE